METHGLSTQGRASNVPVAVGQELRMIARSPSQLAGDNVKTNNMQSRGLSAARGRALTSETANLSCSHLPAIATRFFYTILAFLYSLPYLKTSGYTAREEGNHCFTSNIRMHFPKQEGARRKPYLQQLEELSLAEEAETEGAIRRTK